MAKKKVKSAPTLVKPVEKVTPVVPVVKSLPEVKKIVEPKSIILSDEEVWALKKATEISTAGICDNNLKNILEGIIKRAE